MQHELLKESMSNKRATVSFDTPSKKHGADERPTGLKEGENEQETHEQAQDQEGGSADFGREKRDYDAILNEIEEEIKKMSSELRDVYYESQRNSNDVAKKLELEDRRNELRKRIIQAHEDFKETLKNKGEEEERGKRTDQSRKTAAQSRAETKPQPKADTTEELLARSRVAQLETELAISRTRRLLDLETLSDLELSEFSLPYYYGYYSLYYPYTYRSYLYRYPSRSLYYSYSSVLDYPYSSLYYPYSSLSYLDLTYPSYLDYPYSYRHRYLDPYYYL